MFMCTNAIKHTPLTHRGFCHIVVSLTPDRGASGSDAGHPAPVVHAAGPRLPAGALEGLSQVTHLHHIKVLSKVRNRHPEAEKARSVDGMSTCTLQEISSLCSEF